MRMVDLIIKKRDGGVLTDSEINYIIEGYVNHTIPDYQVSALLMAIYFKGLNNHEINALTSAMLQIGRASCRERV